MTAPTNAGLVTNDPLYAYNTPGYTNQNQGGSGYAALNIEGNVNTGVILPNNSYIGEPEALSGFAGRTIDPIAISNGAGGAGTALANTVAYFAAVEVLNPVTTTKVVVVLKETTSGAVTNLGLYNFAGTRLTTSTVTPSTTAFAPYTGTWAAAQTLAPGTYYIGLSAAATNNTMATVTLTVEQSTLAQATTFAANVLNWRFFQATVVGGALPSPISGTIAGSTVGWFAGIF